MAPCRLVLLNDTLAQGDPVCNPTTLKQYSAQMPRPDQRASAQSLRGRVAQFEMRLKSMDTIKRVELVADDGGIPCECHLTAGLAGLTGDDARQRERAALARRVRLAGQDLFGAHFDPKIVWIDEVGLLHDSDKTGNIATKMTAEAKTSRLHGEPVAVPHTVGKMAEALRVIADQIPVESPAHEALYDQFTSAFLARIESPAPDLRRQVEVLGGLSVRSAQAAHLKRETDEAVLEARSLGVGWTDISRATGITPQAARRRWDSGARKKHSDYERDRKRRNEMGSVDDEARTDSTS